MWSKCGSIAKEHIFFFFERSYLEKHKGLAYCVAMDPQQALLECGIWGFILFNYFPKYRLRFACPCDQWAFGYLTATLALY